MLIDGPQTHPRSLHAPRRRPSWSRTLTSGTSTTTPRSFSTCEHSSSTCSVPNTYSLLPERPRPYPQSMPPPKSRSTLMGSFRSTSLSTSATATNSSVPSPCTTLVVSRPSGSTLPFRAAYSLRLTGSGTLPVPPSYTNKIPNIAFKIPDLEGFAQLILTNIDDGSVADDAKAKRNHTTLAWCRAAFVG